jgi:hypothetical protein
METFIHSWKILFSARRKCKGCENELNVDAVACEKDVQKCEEFP